MAFLLACMAVERDAYGDLDASFGVGTLSFRGDDVGAGSHTGVLASLTVGAPLALGIRPELEWRYATFGEASSAKETNLVGVAPGLRWYASRGVVRPWLGGHLDVSWFSFGGTCTSFDAAPGFVYTPIPHPRATHSETSRH